MSKEPVNLVIVESPAKAKTIKKYLGKNFTVMASYGHVRDLRPKEGAVDPNDNFHMKYEIIEKNSRHLEALIKQLRESDALFLATDPDREGEAISWHIAEVIRQKRGMKAKPIHRIVFHEITKNAVKEAMNNPRDISMELVNAQQTRRALDYLVGFTLSPLLWKKIRGGLSAGRVQSPALRLIVEREEEIEKFIPQEYWTIEAESAARDQPFTARLVKFAEEKIAQFSITNEQHALEVKSTLTKAAKGQLTVANVEKKQRKRNPAAPFITSTLQQEAARKLNFSAQRTMRTAQNLYEAGLITYMRTDSVNLAQEALDDIRELIAKRYGKENLPDEARIYKTKTKNAQEAHEAIRPTSASQTPELIKDTLNPDQLKLYDLIWKRTIASQMIHATLDTVAVDLECGTGNLFRANGSTITDPGFLSVYQEGVDDEKKLDKDEKLLPPMTQGDKITLRDIKADQHFTEPPPRFTEASLVKSLEEFGIGRPSTYATIISTLLNREYVTLEQKRFRPTDVGRVVNRFLTQYFTKYVDYDFTANLENELDAISRGDREWIPLLEEFWSPFKETVVNIDNNVQRKDVTQEQIDEKCPKCQEPLSIRLGKRGRFIGCTAYPECDYTANVDGGDLTNEKPEIVADRKCPECQSDLLIKTGRYGKFIGCSGYPNCKFIEPFEKPEDTGIQCVQCKKGNMLKRKSRRGKIFYSCARYPDCDYAVWDQPIDETCPQCEWPMLTLKTTKRRGTEKVCPQKTCNFHEAVENEESS